MAAWKLLVADREVTCNWGECENESVASRWLTCNLRVSVKMSQLQVDKQLATGGHQKQYLSCKSIRQQLQVTSRFCFFMPTPPVASDLATRNLKQLRAQLGVENELASGLN